MLKCSVTIPEHDPIKLIGPCSILVDLSCGEQVVLFVEKCSIRRAPDSGPAAQKIKARRSAGPSGNGDAKCLDQLIVRAWRFDASAGKPCGSHYSCE